MVVWYVAGNAGGVRGIVAVGTGVSVDTGVSVVTLICAKAVSMAAVMTMFGSIGAGLGWQDANRTAGRIKA